MFLQELQGREVVCHVEVKHKPDCRNIDGFVKELCDKICGDMKSTQHNH